MSPRLSGDREAPLGWRSAHRVLVARLMKRSRHTPRRGSLLRCTDFGPGSPRRHARRAPETETYTQCQWPRVRPCSENQLQWTSHCQRKMTLGGHRRRQSRLQRGNQFSLSSQQTGASPNTASRQGDKSDTARRGGPATLFSSFLFFFSRVHPAAKAQNGRR